MTIIIIMLLLFFFFIIFFFSSSSSYFYVKRPKPRTYAEMPYRIDLTLILNPA